MWHSTSNGLSDPSVCFSSYDREITMVSYVGLCVVSHVARMTTATDKEHLDSLAASRKKRLNGKANLKRSPLILLVVTLTVLSLLGLDSSVASSRMLLKRKADLKRPVRKYRYVIEGSYRVWSGKRNFTIKQRVIYTRKTHTYSHTSQGSKLDTSKNTLTPCTIESSQSCTCTSRLS